MSRLTHKGFTKMILMSMAFGKLSGWGSKPQLPRCEPDARYDTATVALKRGGTVSVVYKCKVNEKDEVLSLSYSLDPMKHDFLPLDAREGDGVASIPTPDGRIYFTEWLKTQGSRFDPEQPFTHALVFLDFISLIEPRDVKPIAIIPKNSLLPAIALLIKERPKRPAVDVLREIGLTIETVNADDAARERAIPYLYPEFMITEKRKKSALNYLDMPIDFDLYDRSFQHHYAIYADVFLNHDAAYDYVVLSPYAKNQDGKEDMDERWGADFYDFVELVEAVAGNEKKFDDYIRRIDGIDLNTIASARRRLDLPDTKRCLDIYRKLRGIEWPFSGSLQMERKQGMWRQYDIARPYDASKWEGLPAGGIFPESVRWWREAAASRDRWISEFPHAALVTIIYRGDPRQQPAAKALLADITRCYSGQEVEIIPTYADDASLVPALDGVLAGHAVVLYLGERKDVIDVEHTPRSSWFSRLDLLVADARVECGGGAVQWHDGYSGPLPGLGKYNHAQVLARFLDFISGVDGDPFEGVGGLFVDRVELSPAFKTFADLYCIDPHHLFEMYKTHWWKLGTSHPTARKSKMGR